jgi:hypothetical protein
MRVSSSLIKEYDNVFEEMDADCQCQELRDRRL